MTNVGSLVEVVAERKKFIEDLRSEGFIIVQTFEGEAEVIPLPKRETPAD